MTSGPKNEGEHMFSIQLKSKDCVKSIAFPNEDGEISIEGFLGKLESLEVTEGIMLEVNGRNGSLRIDLTAQELQRLLEKNPEKPKK
jgi:hypothetical protein